VIKERKVQLDNLLIPLQTNHIFEYVRPQLGSVLETVDKSVRVQSTLSSIDQFLKTVMAYLQKHPDRLSAVSDVINSALANLSSIDKQSVAQFYGEHDITKIFQLLCTPLASQAIRVINLLGQVQLPTDELFDKIVSDDMNRILFMSLARDVGTKDIVEPALRNLIRLVEESKGSLTEYFCATKDIAVRHNALPQFLSTLSAIIIKLCGQPNRNLDIVIETARFLMKSIEQRGEEKQKIVGEIVENVIGPEQASNTDVQFTTGITSLKAIEEENPELLCNGLLVSNVDEAEIKREQRETQKSVLKRIFTNQEASSDIHLNSSDVEELLLSMSKLMGEMCAEIEHGKRFSDDKGEWELDRDAKISRGNIAEVIQKHIVLILYRIRHLMPMEHSVLELIWKDVKRTDYSKAHILLDTISHPIWAILLLWESKPI
jgi:hypothetical protein